MHAFSLSRHAAQRIRQRGVTHQMISDLLSVADIDAPVGGDCRVLRASRRLSKGHDAAVRLSTSPEKLSRLAVVVSDVTGEVVTVLMDGGRRRGRRYRGRP